MNKSEQLIACLEGEIAKRDARIVELGCDCESWADRWVKAVNHGARLEEELAAIKAQARDITAMVDAAMIEMANISPPMRRNECERLIRAALYAAPVSEAKAQGVAPDRAAFETWMLSFEHPVLGWLERESFTFGDDQSTYADEYVQGAWVACSRLNAAPVQQGGDGMCNEGNPADRCICREEFGHRVCAAPPAAPAADGCKACKGTGRRPIGGRGRIFGLTNRCFECQPLTAEEVYGTGDSHE